jgi:hypothetical protein
MTFALTNNPTQSEVSEAINYLLANFGSNLVADNTTGIITGPSGVIIAYLYQFLAVKYADSFDGSVNFSNSPTNRQYYGLRNTSSSVESPDYADYIWYQAAGGFGTTKFLWYQTSGGRQVNFFVGTTAPDPSYVQESGSAIDLDIVTTVVAVNSYNSALPSIFRWTTSSTPPARPSTTSTYTWATGAYTAPAGWSTTQPVDTTAGSYLWAITIPLVVLSTTTTSTLDWTNTSYAIYVAGSNGSNGSAGTAGANGLAAITAYRSQNQSTSAPATPSNTTGATAPAGWSLTAPAVTVGDVLWYSFGQYNSSSGTISGIPAGQTQWGTPTAASVFQDIRSDNWNGSNPPVAGTPVTYGTAGYYIQRATGNMFLNSIYGRGIAEFDGFNNAGGTGCAINVNQSMAQTIGGFFNAGTGGRAISANGGTGKIGVYTHGYNGNGLEAYSFGATGYAIRTEHAFALPALYISNGTIRWGVYDIAAPTGSTSTFLRNDGQWATPSGGSGTVTSVSGTGSVSGLSLSGTVTTSGNITLGGSLSVTQANLIASAPGSAFYLGGTGWNSLSPIMTAAITNSGTATVAGNNLNILGSTSTGIVGAYVGTSGSGSTVTIEVRTTSPSDLRLKEEIADIDVGLAFVKQLRPVSYKLKADPKHQKGYGFIAQEVENLIPNSSSLVYEDPDWKVGDEIGFKTIHYPSYIAVLTKAIQELTAKVEALEAKVT